MGRIGIALLGLASAWIALVYQSSSAEACGFWRLEDTERGQKVHFLLHRTHVEPEGKKKRPIMRITEGKHGLRAKRGERRFLAVVDGELRRRGRVIGEVDGDRVTIRGETYEIDVERLPVKPPHNWRVEVRRGGDAIASGKAMVLCQKYGEEQEEAVGARNIRRRVMYYLAWRAGK